MVSRKDARAPQYYNIYILHGANVCTQRTTCECGYTVAWTLHFKIVFFHFNTPAWIVPLSKYHNSKSSEKMLCLHILLQYHAEVHKKRWNHRRNKWIFDNFSLSVNVWRKVLTDALRSTKMNCYFLTTLTKIKINTFTELIVSQQAQAIIVDNNQQQMSNVWPDAALNELKRISAIHNQACSERMETP